MSIENSRLCYFCRKLESVDQPCPLIQSQPTQIFPSINGVTKPWTKQDEDLLEQLRRRPSELCSRCAKFDIIRAFSEADPLDESQRGELEKAQYIQHAERQGQYRLRFGLLSQFHMKPSCPLCRLLYRLIPRPPPEHDTTVLTLIPYRWHIRQDHWEGVPEDHKRKFAIWFGLSTPGLDMSGPSFFNTGQQLRVAMMTGEAIAMHPNSSSEDSYSARVIEGMVNVDHIRKGLEHCRKHHSEQCNAKFDKGLLITKMLDVNARKVVDCPDNCDYLALSYVWGGIHPADGALEAGILPQTIEDAITLTKRLGKKYLWVGPRSDYGIPGISKSRVGSTREHINGKELATNTEFLDRTSSMFISAVTTYTSRSLTNDGDSLNAFQGGLARFETENGDLIPRMVSIDDKVVTLEGWTVTLDIRTDPFSEVVIPGTDQAIGCVTERNFKHNMTLPTGKYRCLVASRLKKEVLRNGLVNQLIYLVVLKGDQDVEIEERQTAITVSRLAIEGKDFMEFGPKKTVIKMK
uniref:Heterokaryon incompatibility domain-containing protein n=1 Tax=Fusarium oxysporum (strain Fo5176) TaxID=660025 RepID=A0A0D2YGB4_FUSOF